MLLDTWSFVRYIFTDLIGFCYFVLPVLLTFGVQLLLCFKAKRVIFKLLPLFLGPLIVGASYASLFAVRHDVGFEVLLAIGYWSADTAGLRAGLAGLWGYSRRIRYAFQ
ncbi:hypothetical protein [Acutalibacter muris]|jgi:hypothetical protein|uniref:hypothetical protein n=1 Tax=Acutalibacter muris TaxID=1796620 RepID=UPI0026F3DDC3|nr:hypothetical protein [Acutalibacter muris]